MVRASEVEKVLRQGGIKETRRKYRKLLGPVVPPLKKIEPEELLARAEHRRTDET